MNRVVTIVPAGQWLAADAIDRVVLAAFDRNRRRIGRQRLATLALQQPLQTRHDRRRGVGGNLAKL